jgi:hypothetical protein
MEGVVVGQLCRCFSVAPGRIGPPGQVTAVERIVGVEFVPELFVAIDTRIEEPAVLARAVKAPLARRAGLGVR